MAKKFMPPGGGGANMQNLMRQAQKMQQDMLRIQDELAQREVMGSAGGGMVEVTFNAQQEIKSVKINPEVVSPEDVEMLEDLVMAAVAEAMRAAKQINEEEMAKVTGGMSMPGLF